MCWVLVVEARESAVAGSRREGHEDDEKRQKEKEGDLKRADSRRQAPLHPQHYSRLIFSVLRFSETLITKCAWRAGL